MLGLYVPLDPALIGCCTGVQPVQAGVIACAPDMMDTDMRPNHRQPEEGREIPETSDLRAGASKCTNGNYATDAAFCRILFQATPLPLGSRFVKGMQKQLWSSARRMQA
jgi:hypothetical protein